MPTVEEIIKQGSLTAGLEGSRTHTFNVQGLTSTGFPDGDPLYEAYAAVGITYGQPHPKIPLLFCTHIDVKPMNESAKTSAIVQATFTSLHRLFVQVDIQTCEYQTTAVFDRDGKSKVVSYKDAAGTTFKDYGQTKLFRSEVQICFTRIERGNYAKSSDYVEHINSGDWQGKKKGQWRCIAADATSQFGGLRYERRYVFRFRERGWKSDPVIFINRRNGAIPTDIVVDPKKDEGNGFKRFDDYKEADFAGLGLPDVSALI
jgi:hypothetical protein